MELARSPTGIFLCQQFPFGFIWGSLPLETLTWSMLMFAMRSRMVISLVIMTRNRSAEAKREASESGRARVLDSLNFAGILRDLPGHGGRLLKLARPLTLCLPSFREILCLFLTVCNGGGHPLVTYALLGCN